VPTEKFSCSGFFSFTNKVIRKLAVLFSVQNSSTKQPQAKLEKVPSAQMHRLQYIHHPPGEKKRRGDIGSHVAWEV